MAYVNRNHQAGSTSTAASTGTLPRKVGGVMLLDLPSELLTDILSRLPPKEVQFSRSVCAHLPNTVDEDTNHVTIFRPQVPAGLFKHLNSIIGHQRSLDGFIAALAGFFLHRGVQENEIARFHVLFAFAGQWQAHEDPAMVPWYQESSIRKLTIAGFARDITNLHVHLHLPRFDFPYKQVRVPTDPGHFVYAVRPGAASVLHLSRSTVRQLPQSIRDSTVNVGHVLLEGATIRQDNIANGENLPDWPVTHLNHLSKAEAKHMCAEKRARLAGGWSIEALGKMLGVELQHCVKQRWAYDLLRQAEENGSMGWKSRAMVLEQMYLF
ncbi:hypothetical protein LTR85_009452 [Meristemomyces frigidus]|nr:hypothetical protein LTR85_009452 [Meristemomyces frigidus]